MKKTDGETFYASLTEALPFMKQDMTRAVSVVCHLTGGMRVVQPEAPGVVAQVETRLNFVYVDPDGDTFEVPFATIHEIKLAFSSGAVWWAQDENSTWSRLPVS